MLVAIYLRKSRADEGADLEATLHRHQEQLRTLAQARGYQVEQEYREVVSGDSLYARPEMLHLLEKVQEGAYDGVLCMDLDRLGRGGMRDQGIILDTLRQSDTLIITPDKTYDLADDSDDELAEMKAFFARRELKIIKKRLHRGREQTQKSGGFLASPPYGYRKTKLGKLPTLEICEEEAAYVRMMFDLYVNQRVGCTVIARTVNGLGACPHRGSEFGRTTIMAILKNPVYIGKIATNRVKFIPDGMGGRQKQYQPPELWRIQEGVHPPILSEALFHQAQEIISGRYIAPSYTGQVENPLSGLMVCKQCGRLMQRQAPKNKPPYLLCTTKGCVAASKLSRVEQAILGHIYRELSQLEVSPPQADGAGSRGDQEAVSQQRELQILQREQERALRQRERLHDLLEQGVYDVEVFQQRLVPLEQRLQLLRERLHSRQKQREERQVLEREAHAAMVHRHPLACYLGGTPGQQNALLKSVVSSIRYNRPKGSANQMLTLEFVYRQNIE